MDEYRQLLYAYDRVQEIKQRIVDGTIELESSNNSSLLYLEFTLTRCSSF